MMMMMSSYINICNKLDSQQIYSVLEEYGFKNIFSNCRTSIWESMYAQISVDQQVTRILLYDYNEKKEIEEIKEKLLH